MRVKRELGQELLEETGNGASKPSDLGGSLLAFYDPHGSYSEPILNPSAQVQILGIF